MGIQNGVGVFKRKGKLGGTDDHLKARKTAITRY